MKHSFRLCKVCGTDFKVYDSELKKGRNALYCSRKCKGLDMRNGVSKVCLCCGKSFTARANSDRQGYAKYCSRKCWRNRPRTSKVFLCTICKEPFEKTPFYIAHGWTKYCSALCFGIARRTAAYKNSKTLFSPWQRREWLGSKCAICGTKKNLELDHIVPRFAGGSAERSNAQTLCKPCNMRKYHSDKKIYKQKTNQDVHKFSLIDLEARKRATGRKRKHRERLSERTP